MTLGNKLAKYFLTKGKATNIPAFRELTEGSDYDDYREDEDEEDTSNVSYWTPVVFEDHADFNEAQKVARELYVALIAGDARKSKLTGDVCLEKIHAYNSATTRPLRLSLTLGKGIRERIYIKPQDMSRVYGMELENLLSPHKVNFIYGGDCIVEAEIPGKPFSTFSDSALRELFRDPKYVEEFLRFRERCQVMLLGDMHGYNFAVQTLEGEHGKQYVVRPVDFDGLFWHDSASAYDVAEFDSEVANYAGSLGLGLNCRDQKIVSQRERELIGKRAQENSVQLSDLLDIIKADVPEPKKVPGLRNSLASYYNDASFMDAVSMGDLLERLIFHRSDSK